MTNLLGGDPINRRYRPHVFDIEEVCRLLEAGANIVTTRIEMQNPAMLDRAMAARIEAACQSGGSSIYARGSSPGFITEAMPIILTSIQRRLDNLSIMEFADCSSRNSPQMIPEMMGFGQRPGAADCIHSPHAYNWFASSLQLMATAIGLPIESFEVHSDLAPARNDVEMAAGLIHRGTAAATGTTLAGMRDRQEFLSFTSTGFASTDVETPEGEEWEFRTPSGWRVLLKGDCPLDIVISFPTLPENYAAMTPGLTANRSAHAIPFVCSAAPGIRTILDLPQIMTRLG